MATPEIELVVASLGQVQQVAENTRVEQAARDAERMDARARAYMHVFDASKELFGRRVKITELPSSADNSSLPIIVCGSINEASIFSDRIPGRRRYIDAKKRLSKDYSPRDFFAYRRKVRGVIVGADPENGSLVLKRFNIPSFTRYWVQMSDAEGNPLVDVSYTDNKA